MIEHLFHEVSHKATGEAIRTHTHPFWQVEILRQGRIVSTADGLDYDSRAGDLLWIPPHAEHSLICQEGPSRCLILKFRAQPGRRSTVHLRTSPLRDSLVDALTELLPDPPQPPDEATRRQVGFLLQILFEHAYPAKPATSRSLLDRIDAYLAKREGGYVTVHDIARLAGYSVSHTSRLFRQEHGESLKEYLDRKRASISHDLLTYSELTIAEIAAHQEFNDLSAFSRFVRRHLGKPPRAIRDG